MFPSMHNAQSVPRLTTLQNAFYNWLVVMQNLWKTTEIERRAIHVYYNSNVLI